VETITTVAVALDVGAPAGYDPNGVHPRLNARGRCMSCGRAAAEACEWPYDPDEIDLRDGDVTDYAGLIDVTFGGTR